MRLGAPEYTTLDVSFGDAQDILAWRILVAEISLSGKKMNRNHIELII